MVVRLAEGAPVAAFAVAVAPIAPDPLVPVVSTPVKLTTVIDDCTDCENVAVTVMSAERRGTQKYARFPTYLAACSSAAPIPMSGWRQRRCLLS